MKKGKWNSWKAWLGTSLLAALLMPVLYSHADLVRMTQARMLRLAGVMEQLREQTGSYPHKLEAAPLGEVLPPGEAQTALRDAWRRPFVYCRKKGSGNEGSEEFWLGSSCGKMAFGGFLGHMTGQKGEGRDLVMRNGRFLSVPLDDFGKGAPG